MQEDDYSNVIRCCFVDAVFLVLGNNDGGGMGVRLCVCMSVCLCVRLSVRSFVYSFGCFFFVRS